MEESIKLNEKDMKLLAYLYHSHREPLTKIAKATGLTREQVEYKIDKFVKEGVIRKFMTMFNNGAFGYGLYAFMLVKFERFASKDNFVKKLDGNKNCMSWGECSGKYDIFMNLVFRDEKEIQEYLAYLLNESSEPVADYALVRPYFSEFHPLKWFKDGEKDNFPLIFDEVKEKKFDKHEIEMMKMLEKDGRVKLIDISSKLGISSELALYKMRKLQKDKVILGSKIHFDMKKLGYNYSGFFVNIKNFSDKTKNKIIHFARKHKLVNALVLSVTNPNCFIQLFHKTEEELKETISEFREMLKDERVDLDIILLTEENRINTLPFLK